MTAVDDLSIFSGSHSYIISATSGSTLCRTISCRSRIWRSFRWPPTLERGQPLLITTSGAGGGLTSAPMRIKVPDVIRNVKIVVHSVYSPFPHINPVAAAYGSILGGSEVSGGDQTMEGTCAALDGHEVVVSPRCLRSSQWWRSKITMACN